MTELTGISGNLWECFAAPLGQDSTPWFFSHFSVYHWLFHLFSLLSSPHTVFTCNRRYLLLSGPEQPGTPLRNSAHCRDRKCWPTQIMEILKIFFPCPFYTRFPTNSLGSWLVTRSWLVFGFYSCAFENCIGTDPTKAMLHFFLRVIGDPVPSSDPGLSQPLLKEWGWGFHCQSISHLALHL